MEESKTIDCMLKHPFGALVVGGSQTGKTSFTKKLIRNIDGMVHPKPQRIVWCYGEDQPSYAELHNNPNVTMHHGPPDVAELKSSGSRIPTLIVFDDLQNTYQKKKADELSKLYQVGCHHYSLSILHLVQNLFHEGLRGARINAQYIILMRNPSDHLQVCNLARQVFPKQTPYFMEAYRDACCKPYSYLLLDLSPQTDDCYRLRTNIFPDEIQYVYVPSH